MGLFGEIFGTLILANLLDGFHFVIWFSFVHDGGKNCTNYLQRRWHCGKTANGELNLPILTENRDPCWRSISKAFDRRRCWFVSEYQVCQLVPSHPLILCLTLMHYSVHQLQYMSKQFTEHCRRPIVQQWSNSMSHQQLMHGVNRLLLIQLP